MTTKTSFGVSNDIFLHFETRSAAEAGNSLGAEYLFVDGLFYTYDPSGTALTTGDGRNWYPAMEWTGEHFGMIADGVDTGSDFTGSDNSDAFEAAINAAARTGNVLKITSGTYRFAPLTSTNTNMAELTELGASYRIHGAGNVIFLIDDTATTVGNTTFMETTGNGVSSSKSRFDRFEMRNIEIRGTFSHSANPTHLTPHIFELEGFDTIDIKDCKITDIMGLVPRFYHINLLKVRDCEFVRCGRGAMSPIYDVNRAILTNNYFYQVDDDATAIVPADDGLEPPSAELIYVGNTHFMAESLLQFGARRQTIVGNVFWFSKSIAVRVGGYLNGTQWSASDGVVIANNIAIDSTTRYTGGMLTADDATAAFMISGTPLSDATTAAGEPGSYDSVGGGIVDVLGQDDAGDWLSYGINGASMSIGPTKGITITGNVALRTVSPSANFSDYGIGDFYTVEGFVDPQILETNLARHAFVLQGTLHGVTVSGNTAIGFRSGAGVFFKAHSSSTNRDREFSDVLVANNTITDCKFAASSNAGGLTGAPFTWDIGFHGNKFDLDPWLVQSVRTTPIDGTWQSDGTVGDTSRPSLMMVGVEGFSVVDNEFRNCFIPVQTDAADENPMAAAHIEGNLVICDPVSSTFSTSNKGVGRPMEGGPAFRHMIVDEDPASATFRQMKNTCPLQSRVRPNAGTWVKGTVVHHSDAALSGGKVNFGYYRLTTGSGHVLNTDWSDLFATNS